MVPTTVWKASTLVASATAMVLAATRPGHHDASGVVARTETSVEQRDEREGSPGGCVSAPRRSRLGELAARLQRARSADLACALITELAATRERGVVAVLLATIRERTADQTRQCAVDALANIPGDEALDGLTGLARDSLLRASVFDALARSEDPAALALVLDAADSPERDERLDALAALGSARRPEAVPMILRAFADAPEDSDAYDVLVTALGRSGDPAALPALERFARGSGERRRAVAVQALGALGLPGSVTALREILLEDGAAAQEAAGALLDSTAPGAVDALLDVAQAGGSAGLYALDALAHWDGEEPREFMLAQLRGDDGQRAGAALRYFAARRDQLAVPELVALVQRAGSGGDADRVLETIASIGGDAGRDALARLASEGPPEVRHVALNELHTMPGGGALAADLALRWFRSDDHGFSAFDALASEDDREAREALVAAARGGRAGAVWALGQLHDTDAERSLVEIATSSGEVPGRRLAFLRLGELRDDAAADAALRGLRDPDAEIQSAARQALMQGSGEAFERALAQAARVGSDSDREQAARRLVSEGSSEALAQAEALARGGDPVVRNAVVDGLVRRAPQRAAGVLADLVRAPDAETARHAITASENLDDAQARPLAIAALHHADSSVVEMAAGILGDDASPEALRALGEALGNPSTPLEVRAGIAEILRDRGGAAADQYLAAIEAVLPAQEPQPSAETDGVYTFEDQ